MKFTPSDYPKKPTLLDPKKKIHVTFGENGEQPKPVKIAKRPLAPVASIANKTSEPTPDHVKSPKKRKLAENNKGPKAVAIGVPGVAIGVPGAEPSSNNNNKKNPTGPRNPRGPAARNQQGRGNGMSRRPQQPRPLTEEERLAKKQKRRDKKKARRNAIKTVDGTKVYNPKLQLELSKMDRHIKIDDIRTLLISGLADIATPQWVKITNRGHIKKVVVMYLPGLDPADFGLTDLPNYDVNTVPKYIELKRNTSDTDKNLPAAYKSMPYFIQQFSHMLVSLFPSKKKEIGREFVQMLQCQVSLNERMRREEARKKRLEECKDNMNEYFMFSLAQLQQYRYPIPPFLDPSVTLPEDWKETHAVKEVLPRKRLMALDCEMVKTETGSALARVTLVDEDGTTLLDEIVKPEEPVIDYLTEYSGMTRDLLADGISLRRAQKHIRKLVTHNVILVGHGLENDLKALKLAHPYCADTAILYDSQLGPPHKPRLRSLAGMYLHRRIQNRQEDKAGHDSAEDARAALDLFKLKVEKGEDFGKGRLDMELIFNRLDQIKPSRTSALLEKTDRPRYLLSIMHPADYTVCDSEENLVARTIEANKKYDFVVCQMQTLKYLDEEDMSEVPTVFSYDVDQKKRMVHERMIMFDRYFQEMYQGFEPGTLVVVMGGYSPELFYNNVLKRYRKSLRKYPDEEQDKWTEYDTLTLDTLIRKGRYGGFFCKVKGYRE